MKKYVFESLKFFCAAILCTILSAFTTPALADLDPCRNLCDENAWLENKACSTRGTEVASSGWSLSPYIPVDANTVYTWSKSVSDKPAYLFYFSSPSESGFINYKSIGTVKDYTFTTPAGTKYVRLQINAVGTQLSDIEQMLELGSTATSYVPYNATCDDRCKNLFDKSTIQQGLHNENGVINNNISSWVASDMRIPVTASQTYTVMADATETGTTVVTNVVMFKDNEYVGYLPTTAVPFSFTPDSTYNQIELQFAYEPRKSITKSSITNIQLERGSTATAYVPYCETSIKIATTKYNESAFGPLNAALQNAISVVDTVVSNTITQAASIATLQTQKQTRPNDIADDSEKCPAGKKCLLVEDASGVPHWYEIVENAWDLPVGYTQLQYIESTGGQYIDTGLAAGSNTRVLAQYKLNSVGFTSPISVRDENSAGAGFGVGVNGSQQFISDYNGDRKVFTTITPNATDIITVDKNKNVCTITIGGQSETVTNTASTFTTTNTLPFFAQNSAGSMSSGKYIFYSFKMWNNNTLVRDFVPAKNSSGVVGMYDKVSGEFFENAGTGEFTAGNPVVE